MMVPAGWRETSVGNSSKFITGFPFESASFSETGTRLVRGSNVKRAMLDWNPTLTKHWAKPDSSLRTVALAAGDIVVAMDGALVGRSFARISKTDLPAYLVQRVARLRGTSVDQDLLYAWITSDAFANHVDSVKTHTAIPHISPRDIRSFAISVPESAIEQKSIAKAISDADSLVRATERLVAKKQAIKQGMIQQLFTGKTRLPGFDSPWRQCALSEVLTVRHGRSQHDVERPDGQYPILATGGEIGRTNTPLYSKPSVLIGRKGTIDRPQYRDEPFWTVDTLFYTEIHEPNVPKYVYYLFLTIDWRSKNEASGVPSLSSSAIESINAVMPGFEEQRAIAKVLTNADAEIHILETRLAKAKSIKLGMMQELLTGRTRLKSAVVAV